MKPLQPKKATILIQNLHQTIDDKTLHELFSEFGSLIDCKVITDTQTGISQAYLYYIDHISAIKALIAIQASNGLSIYGSKVIAKLYQSKQETTHFQALNVSNICNNEQKQNSSQIKQNHDEISLWLTNEVGLPQYIELFKSNGVEDIETVQLLEINDIKQEMGLTNIKHINHIMQCIQKLNQPQLSHTMNDIDAMQQFAIDIDNFIRSILPKKQEIIARDCMFKYITARVCDLQKMRNMKNRSIRMHAYKFGSELWKVSCRGSDIDVAITVNFRNHRSDKQELLDDLLQIIFHNNPNGLYIIDEDYVKLLNATYPIVRIQHKISHIEMDISVADRFCIPTNQYVLQCIDKYRNQFNIPIRNLIIFVKYWSKQREINDAYHRYLNSFGYTMMILYYMKHHILQRNFSTNLVHLLYGFFKFYAAQYNFDKYSISIKSNYHNTNNIFTNKFGCHPIEIIDPMKTGKSMDKNNVAVKTGYYQRYHIIYEFRRAYHILCTQNPKQSLFNNLIQKERKDNLDFRNVYVKHIPSQWNETTIRQIFEENTGGSITKLKMWAHEFGVYVCLLTFASSQHAKIAVENLNDAQIGNDNGVALTYANKLYVGRAYKIEQKQIMKLNVAPKCNLYVSNLPNIVDEAKLSDIFGTCGNIISIKVMRDVNGKSKGYGFVAFDHEQSAAKAINLTYTKHYGNRIHVAYARIGNDTNETNQIHEKRSVSNGYQWKKVNDEKNDES